MHFAKHVNKLILLSGHHSKVIEFFVSKTKQLTLYVLFFVCKSQVLKIYWTLINLVLAELAYYGNKIFLALIFLFIKFKLKILFNGYN